MGIRCRATASMLLLGLLVTLAPPAAAAPDPEWSSAFPGEITGVAADRHGNTYAVGERRVRVGGRRLDRLVVARYGPAGNLAWVRSWGPPRNAPFGPVVDVAPDGAVVVGGSINGLKPGFCTGWFLRSYAPDGGLRWHREQPGARRCAGFDQVSAVSAGANLIVLTGNDVSEGLGAVHGWVRGFGSDGATRWGHPLRYVGGPKDGYDAANDVAVSALGRVYVVGTVSRRRDDGDYGSFRRLIVKLTPDGGLIWSRILPDSAPGEPDADRAESVSVLGRWLAVGGAVTQGRAQRTWVAHLSFDGSVIRERRPMNVSRRATEVAVTMTGATYVVRTTGSGTALMYLSPRLRPRWVWELDGFLNPGATLAVGGGGVVTTTDRVGGPGSIVWRFPA
jgi:hypothetical protein